MCSRIFIFPHDVCVILARVYYTRVIQYRTFSPRIRNEPRVVIRQVYVSWIGGWSEQYLLDRGEYSSEENIQQI